MLKTKFEAQQYLIREAEIKLHNDTQMLLTEMLRSLSKENLLKLNDHNLEDIQDSVQAETIKSVNITDNSISFLIYGYDCFTYNKSIDNLSQPAQKELIDFILENNLVKNS